MGFLGGIGPTELIIILVIALLIFGPKNLPKLGASLGKTVKNIRKGMDEDEVKDPTSELNASEKVLPQEDDQVK